MPLETWQAAVGGAVTALSAGASGIAVRRSRGERESSSAKVLAQAYSLLVDDLRKDLDRQDREMKELRDELRSVMAAREQEIAALRLELATERSENLTLRQRVTELEARFGRRRTDDVRDGSQE